MNTSKTYRRKELAATIALLLAAYPTVYAQEQADAAALKAAGVALRVGSSPTRPISAGDSSVCASQESGGRCDKH